MTAESRLLSEPLCIKTHRAPILLQASRKSSSPRQKSRPPKDRSRQCSTQRKNPLISPPLKETINLLRESEVFQRKEMFPRMRISPKDVPSEVRLRHALTIPFRLNVLTSIAGSLSYPTRSRFPEEWISLPLSESTEKLTNLKEEALTMGLARILTPLRALFSRASV